MLFYRKVPKKLLQEQGSRPPAYSPPPSAHDPNIVGDSPPEGSSVRNPPNAVSGKDTHTHTQHGDGFILVWAYSDQSGACKHSHGRFTSGVSDSKFNCIYQMNKEGWRTLKHLQLELIRSLAWMTNMVINDEAELKSLI